MIQAISMEFPTIFILFFALKHLRTKRNGICSNFTIFKSISMHEYFQNKLLNVICCGEKVILFAVCTEFKSFLNAMR